ncbi:MAG: hypothetical protein IKJ39_05565 [Lachnospiraceae bacterium]|nr:hypothetical protein [Lachnospiraceae bacterium]MBR3824649.1 hypothetical protein [Lachnospiraceae bacterium]MBR4059397.1 hypothetical protein [Lachnospiraceae bacterium]MBR4084331.1 hypothetical protein [Lachnospiraceae bacterium]MBR6664360.1 hypothetical protein [Lachnospiraceae bacterium]
MILFLTVQLMLMFVSYRRMSWLSETITDGMTDALLGAAVLEEEELYAYGRSDELQILYPKEKYDIFKDLLRQELGLTNAMTAVRGSVPVVDGNVQIEDFVVYSVNGSDVTVYDFDETGAYVTTIHPGQKDVLTAPNGMSVRESSLFAKIRFQVRYMGVPMNVSRYHMVDIVDE